ncbi:alpha/beta fold hydrolase [Kocuria rhizosphaericola]|uniref:alpha/beta fold hydrolase n=1 Tax=Kocuria rhizosphaericola TaxID=3376284 RepID=UPI00378C897A
MASHRHLDQESSGTDPIPRTGRPRRPWWRRLARFAGFAVLGLLVLVLVSTGLNAALTQYERTSTDPYGQRVPVDGGSVNVVDHAADGPTVVLLSGLGTPAPALDFAPLVRDLDGYRVVVAEGFGYGYADMTAPERTVENVSQELRSALEAAGVEGPYVLAGHSLAGFYILDYVNRYPGEVSAVVGIDTTVPAFAAGQDHTPAAEGGGVPWDRLASSTGLVRWVLLAAPDLALPADTAHTAEEREQINRMTIWNFANPAVTDETRRIGDNAHQLEDVRFPADLPVLMLLAQDTVGESSDWLASHEEQLQGVNNHELVVLDGPHYLHWTRSPEIATRITAFLDEHDTSTRDGPGIAAPATAG